MHEEDCLQREGIRLSGQRENSAPDHYQRGTQQTISRGPAGLFFQQAIEAQVLAGGHPGDWTVAHTHRPSSDNPG